MILIVPCPGYSSSVSNRPPTMEDDVIRVFNHRSVAKSNAYTSLSPGTWVIQSPSVTGIGYHSPFDEMQVGYNAGNVLGRQFTAHWWRFGIDLFVDATSSLARPNSQELQFRLLVCRFRDLGLSGYNRYRYIQEVFRPSDSTYYGPFSMFRSHWESVFEVLMDEIVEVPITMTTNGATPTVFTGAGSKSFIFNVPLGHDVSIDNTASYVSHNVGSVGFYDTTTYVNDGDVQLFVIPASSEGAYVYNNFHGAYKTGFIIDSTLLYSTK